MGMVASPGSSGCCFTKTISLSVSSGTSLGRNHVLMAELLNVAEHWLQYAFEPALSDGRHHLKNGKQCSIAERLSENRPQIFGASEAFFTQRMGFRWQARIETRSFPLVVRVYFSGAACFASGVLGRRRCVRPQSRSGLRSLHERWTVGRRMDGARADSPWQGRG